MARITIRNLDDGVKTRLRLRAGGNGRSMEEEARLILSRAVEWEPRSANLASRPRASPVRLRRPSVFAGITPTGRCGNEEGAVTKPAISYR